MGQMKVIIISLLLFSGVVMGMTSFYGDLSSTYGKNPNMSNLTSLNQTLVIQNDIKQYKGAVEDQSITGDFLDVPLTIVTGVYNILKMFLNSINIFGSLIFSINNTLQLPDWFVGIVISIITIIIVLTIVSAIMKWDL